MKNTILLSLFLVLGVSCQKNNSDLLQEAQNCLNTAPASQARSCVEKISSLSTPSAYRLRCSAIYISEGYGAASSLIGALDEMNSPSGGSGCSGNCSPTLIVMSKFKFSSGDNQDPVNRDRNIATADEAIDLCQATGSKAFLQLSSLFKMGTLATMQAYSTGITPGQTPTVAEIETAVQNLPPVEIGELVSSTYSLTCSDNSKPSESTKKYCEQLSESIGSYGTNYQLIGECLLAKLQNESATCP